MPRSRQPVVRFLTFFIVDQRSDDEELRFEEEPLVHEFPRLDEEDSAARGGFLIVSWYMLKLLISLGLILLGLGLAEDTKTPFEDNGPSVPTVVGLGNMVD